MIVIGFPGHAVNPSVGAQHQHPADDGPGKPITTLLSASRLNYFSPSR
jgi:hypothetical protein